MRHTATRAGAAAVALWLVCACSSPAARAGGDTVPGVAPAQARDARFTFDRGTDGWDALAAPIGSDVKVSAERDGTAGVLVVRYRPVPGKLAGVTHAVDGLSGRGLRLRLKADSSSPIVVGAVVSDGSMYQTVVQTQAGAWQDVRISFEQLKPADNAKNKSGVFRPADARTLVVADPAGFLNADARDRTLWIDELEVESGAAASGGPSYAPLVTLGLAAPTGARASTGIAYRPGKFGQGVLLDSPGEAVIVPVFGLGGREGTIEAWIAPQFPMSQARDFSALFAMQDEPFLDRLPSSLIVSYGTGGRINVLANGAFDRVLSSSVLDWSPGEWHHVAVSWGRQGLKLYVDGRLAGSRATPGDFGAHSVLVVGNHAWTTVTHLVSRTVFDELRVSSIQRSDDEIRGAAAASRPLQSDSSTAALEHFDGMPVPPVRLAGDALTLHEIAPASSIDLRVAIPFAVTAGATLGYEISTPGGAKLQQGQLTVARDGPQEITLRPPGAYGEGFYRIAFTLAASDAGADWFRVRSRPIAGTRSLFFGAAGHLMPEDPDQFFAVAAAVGVRSCRTAFEWSEIEPREGVFAWERYDRVVAAAARHGIELVPTLFWELPQPSWAGPGSSRAGWTESKYPPTDLGKWGDFVYQVVARYKASIHWWIPSNEPNLAQFWYPRPDARAYVAFLKATRAAARRADPQARLLGGSVAGFDLPFLEQVFKAGALDVIDAVGVHAYIAPHDPDDRFPLNNFDASSEPGTFSGGLAAVQQLIQKYHGSQQIWIDEIGQPYREDFVIPRWSVSEAEAASRLAKIYVEAFASRRVDRVMWFSLWGGEYGSFALARPDLVPALPLAAYASLADWLAGAEFVRDQSSQTQRSYSFRGPRGAFDVVWSTSGSSIVDVTPGDKVFDVFGSPASVPASGRFDLTGAPWIIQRSGGR